MVWRTWLTLELSKCFVLIGSAHRYINNRPFGKGRGMVGDGGRAELGRRWCSPGTGPCLLGLSCRSFGLGHAVGRVVLCHPCLRAHALLQITPHWTARGRALAMCLWDVACRLREPLCLLLPAICGTFSPISWSAPRLFQPMLRVSTHSDFMTEIKCFQVGIFNGNINCSIIVTIIACYWST